MSMTITTTSTEGSKSGKDTVAATEVIHKFLAGFAARDSDALIAMLAPDVLVRVPYAPKGTPKELRGESAIDLYKDLDTKLQKIEVVSEETYGVTDPSTGKEDPTIAISFATTSGILGSGKAYSQNIILYIKLNKDGKIQELRDIYDGILWTEIYKDAGF